MPATGQIVLGDELADYKAIEPAKACPRSPSSRRPVNVCAVAPATVIASRPVCCARSDRVPATGPTGAPLGGTCDAAPAQSFVGQNNTAKVVEAARVRSGALMVRVLRPGQMVTKEFDAQRLNLEVNAAGRIIAVRCG